jgi:hypothetical protein
VNQNINRYIFQTNIPVGLTNNSTVEDLYNARQYRYLMPPKEAKARIKINNLMIESGWRLIDDRTGNANVV